MSLELMLNLYLNYIMYVILYVSCGKLNVVNKTIVCMLVHDS